MPCPFTSPVGAVAAVQQCALAYLTSIGRAPNPSAVGGGEALLGANDPTSGRDCCGPILSVSIDSEILAQNPDDVGIDGCGPCEDYWNADITVRFLTCWETFNPSGFQGEAVAAAVQNQAWLQMMTEGWGMVEALKCCICNGPPGANDPLEWSSCNARVTSHGYDSPQGSCAGYHVVLRVELLPCCRGVPDLGG